MCFWKFCRLRIFDEFSGTSIFLPILTAIDSLLWFHKTRKIFWNLSYTDICRFPGWFTKKAKIWTEGEWYGHFSWIHKSLALATRSPCYSLLSSTFFRVVEVWKSMKNWRYCRYEPFLILYLVPHFACLQKCGEVWQSRDKVAIIPLLRTPCNSLVRSTLLRALKVPWNIVWPT